jgi:uncharacterized membrane protein
MERRGKSSKKVILIIFLFFFIWILLQFLAPIIVPSGTMKDLSGITAVTNNKELINKLPIPWSYIYGCGDILCHQIDSRSLFINENQMPFCSRCTAIFLGITIGLGFLFFYNFKLDEKFIILFIIGIIPIAIDGLGQLFGLWESNNIIRTITGLLIGIVCGIAIGIIAEELREFKLIKKNKN